MIYGFFLNTKLIKKINRKRFFTVWVNFSINATSSSSSDIMLSANWASSTSDSVISNGLSVFCCSLKNIICSLRTLYTSAQGLPGLRQLICWTSSPLSSIFKAYFLNEESTFSFGRNFYVEFLRGTVFMLPLFVNSWTPEHHRLTIHHIVLRLFVWKVYSKVNQEPEYIFYISQVQLRFQH